MIAAELFSDLGNQFVHLTLMAVLFFRRDDCETSLLLLCLFQQAPAIFFSAMAGRWIDRIGPKTALVAANLVKGLLVAGLLLTRGVAPVWCLYFLFMVASLMFYISRLAITPRLIPKARLISYNAVNERVALTGGILGPWLIGLTIQFAGDRAALAMGACMFLFSGLLARGLPDTGGTRNPVADIVPKLSEWRMWLHYRISPLYDDRVKGWIGWMGMLVIGGGLLNFAGPLFNKTYFGDDIAAWGMVMSGYQAGACLAAMLLPALSSRLSDRAVISGGFLLIGTGFALLAVFQQQLLFAGVMAGFGFGFTLLCLFLESRIQRDCAGNRCIPTMAALAAGRSVCLLFGIMAGFTVAGLCEVPACLMAAGALTLVICAWISVKTSKKRGL